MRYQKSLGYHFPVKVNFLLLVTVRKLKLLGEVVGDIVVQLWLLCFLTRYTMKILVLTAMRVLRLQVQQEPIWMDGYCIFTSFSIQH